MYRYIRVLQTCSELQRSSRVSATGGACGRTNRLHPASWKECVLWFPGTTEQTWIFQLQVSQVHPWTSLKFLSSSLLCLQPSVMIQVNNYKQNTTTIYLTSFSYTQTIIDKTLTHVTFPWKRLVHVNVRFAKCLNQALQKEKKKGKCMPRLVLNSLQQEGNQAWCEQMAASFPQMCSCECRKWIQSWVYPWTSL